MFTVIARVMGHDHLITITIDYEQLIIPFKVVI